jgi:hypothetical protein
MNEKKKSLHYFLVNPCNNKKMLVIYFISLYNNNNNNNNNSIKICCTNCFALYLRSLYQIFLHVFIKFTTILFSSVDIPVGFPS